MEATPVDRASDMQPAERVAALEPLLADGDPRVRKSGAIALGRLACPEAARALCGLLDDPDEGVRVLACQGLGRAADAASAPAIVAHVHDGSPAVRAGLLWALANLAAHGGLDGEERAALFTPVVVLAFDPDDGVRADAAAVLGSLRDPRAADALSVLLEDGVARVRANACASIGLLDDPAGAAALVAQASKPDEDPLVLVSAADALARRAERGSLGEAGPDALRVLCRLAAAGDGDGGDPHAPVSDAGDVEAAPTRADVRATAVWALGLVAPAVPGGAEEACGVLEGALACADAWTCRYAAEALARVGGERARCALEGFSAQGAPLSEDPEILAVVEAALQSLRGAC